MLLIDGFAIDAEILSEHSFSNDVTENPVEDGIDVTDNVRARPLQITIEGLVSDTPLGSFVELREEVTTKPSETAYAVLQEINELREPVTITTSLQEFPNMVIQALSVPRSSKNGEALRFRAVFKQVRLISNDRTFVLVAVPRANKKRKRGSKTSKEAQASADAQNVAKKMKESLSGIGSSSGLYDLVNR